MAPFRASATIVFLAAVTTAVAACSSVTEAVVASGPEAKPVGVIHGCRTLHRPPPSDIEHTRLRDGPAGTIELQVKPVPPPARPPLGHDGTWHPSGPLPPLATPGKRVEIFYTPHPDDETLSMAPVITRAKAGGIRPIVVVMTDGSTTGAIRIVNLRLSRATRTAPVPVVLSPAAIGQARDAELRKAAKALGVAPTDLFFAHLDRPKSDCGALISVGEARDVMLTMARRYRGATHVTMSNAAERNTDHLACGVALRRLADQGVIKSARWTVSRLWWSVASPRYLWVVPGSPQQRLAIESASAAYSLWDPAHHSYAIGALSVASQFKALELDPRALVNQGG